MSPLRPTGAYGATTDTVPAMITDEWSAQHLPLTTVALAAAVPVIEAELRERIAREIEAEATQPCESWERSCACGQCTAHEESRYAAAIARGQK